VGTPEQLSLSALIEEQVLLALPLVPMHEPGAPGCLPTGAESVPLAPKFASPSAAQAADDEKQTPFANLRELLGKQGER
jgi:uncharacterized metal-binding protein YceD (DUF177 family)